MLTYISSCTKHINKFGTNMAITVLSHIYTYMNAEYSRKMKSAVSRCTYARVFEVRLTQNKSDFPLDESDGTNNYMTYIYFSRRCMCLLVLFQRKSFWWRARNTCMVVTNIDNVAMHICLYDGIQG